MSQYRLLPPLPPAAAAAAAPIAEDVLRGADAIAAFLGLRPKQVYRLAEKARAGGTAPPIFNDGTGLAARKSSVLAWYKRREEEALAPKALAPKS